MEKATETLKQATAQGGDLAFCVKRFVINPCTHVWGDWYMEYGAQFRNCKTCGFVDKSRDFDERCIV